MEPLIIKATSDTPYICLDKGNGKFEIMGVSLPSNIFEFYEPVLEWLHNYSSDPNNETVLKLQFDYLNSSSTKMLHNIITTVEHILNNGQHVVVNWYYEHGDSEMKEMGEDFASNCNVPFRMIASKQTQL